MYTIIVKEGCVWCDKAVSLLDEKFECYEYFDLKFHRWLILLMKESGNTTVPLIFDEGVLIGGYKELEEILKDKESEL
jgi:glutaredoxin